jgi:hypothetical protein
MFYKNIYISPEDQNMIANQNSKLLNEQIKQQYNIKNIYDYKQLYYNKNIDELTNTNIKLKELHEYSKKNGISIF